MNFTDSSNEYNDEVSELNNAWRTEVNCPELLPYKQALIDSMSTSLNSQMNFIENRVNQTASDMFAISLYQMDIDRIRYSLARYLRTRILKIEENIDLVIARQDIFDNLSMKEQIFAAKLHNTRNEYMDDTFFSKVDDNLKESLEKIYNRMKETQPNLQNFVFCRATEDLTGVDVGADNSLENYSQGEIFVAQYYKVRDYVLNGKLDLL